MRNRNGVTRVTAKAARETIVFCRILDADMDLESVQTNDGEMQIDTKQIEKYGEREGTSERDRREERHNGATGHKKLP